MAEQLIAVRKWPCYFFKSDTTGEKDFEEFYTDEEDLDLERFEGLGVIRNAPIFDEFQLEKFVRAVGALRNSGSWTKDSIVELFYMLLPDFAHQKPANIWIKRCDVNTNFRHFFIRYCNSVTITFATSHCCFTHVLRGR